MSANVCWLEVGNKSLNKENCRSMFQSSRVNNEASSTDITKDYNSQSSVMKLENKHVLAKLVMEKDLSFFFFCQSNMCWAILTQRKLKEFEKEGIPFLMITLSKGC